MKTKTLKMILFLLTILTTILHPQSVGVGIESSYYYVSKELFFKYLDEPITNFILNYDHNINDALQISFNIGYGASDHHFILNQPAGEIETDQFYKISSKGIPLSIEFRYKGFFANSEIIEPFIGLGISYCNYETKAEEGSSYYNFSNQSTLITKGFSQYVSLGANVQLTENVTSYFLFKKMLVSNIRTKGGMKFMGYSEGSKFEEDYSIKEGLNGVGIMFGLGYTF